MNIALCFAGEPRFWEYGYKNIQHLKDINPDIDIDVFIHTWDTITWADPSGDIPFVDTCRTRVAKWNIACTKFFRLYIYNRLMGVLRIQMLCLFLVFVSSQNRCCF